MHNKCFEMMFKLQEENNSLEGAGGHMGPPLQPICSYIVGVTLRGCP